MLLLGRAAASVVSGLSGRVFAAASPLVPLCLAASPASPASPSSNHSLDHPLVPAIVDIRRLQRHSAPSTCSISTCANPEILPPPPNKTGEPPWLVTCMNLEESGRRLVTRQKRGAGPSGCSSQEPRGARVFPVAGPSALHHPNLLSRSFCSRSQAHAVTQSQPHFLLLIS